MPRSMRYRMMRRERKHCHYCDQTAAAYRLEEDRMRTYLCIDHIPITETDDLSALVPRTIGAQIEKPL
jgi:hypothetical protein